MEKKKSADSLEVLMLTPFYMNYVINLHYHIRFTFTHMTDLEMKSLSHEGTRQNYYALSSIFCTTFLISGWVSFSFLLIYFSFLWPAPPLFLTVLNTFHAVEVEFSIIQP